MTAARTTRLRTLEKMPALRFEKVMVRLALSLTYSISQAAITRRVSFSMERITLNTVRNSRQLTNGDLAPAFPACTLACRAC